MEIKLHTGAAAGGFGKDTWSTILPVRASYKTSELLSYLVRAAEASHPGATCTLQLIQELIRAPIKCGWPDLSTPHFSVPASSKPQHTLRIIERLLEVMVILSVEVRRSFKFYEKVEPPRVRGLY